MLLQRYVANSVILTLLRLVNRLLAYRFSMALEFEIKLSLFKIVALVGKLVKTKFILDSVMKFNFPHHLLLLRPETTFICQRV